MVSICWVAISIDMVEVTAKAPPTLLLSFSSVEKSPLDKWTNDWEASPEVGGLVEPSSSSPRPPPPPPPPPPSVSWAAHSERTSTLAINHIATRIRSDAPWSVRQDGLFGNVCFPGFTRSCCLAPSCSPLPSTALWLSLFDFSQPLDLFSLTLLPHRVYQSLSLQDKSSPRTPTCSSCRQSVCLATLSLPWFTLSLIRAFLPPR